MKKRRVALGRKIASIDANLDLKYIKHSFLLLPFARTHTQKWSHTIVSWFQIDLSDFHAAETANWKRYNSAPKSQYISDLTAASHSSDEIKSYHQREITFYAPIELSTNKTAVPRRRGGEEGEAMFIIYIVFSLSSRLSSSAFQLASSL